MKPNACLAMQQTVVPPGTEVTRRLEQWSFIRVCAGMGYARADRQNIALKPGDLVVDPFLCSGIPLEIEKVRACL